MSNQKCEGVAYPLGGRYWYRCFGDGSVFELHDACPPDKCPKCQKPVKADVLDVEPRSRVVVEVELEVFSGSKKWVTHSREDS